MTLERKASKILSNWCHNSGEKTDLSLESTCFCYNHCKQIELKTKKIC